MVTCGRGRVCEEAREQVRGEEWGRVEGASGGVACGEPADAEVNNHPTAPTPALHDSGTFRLPF